MDKTLWAVIALLAISARASAHHEFAAEYDEKSIVTITGTVSSFKWTNPHTWLYLDGNDAGGKPVRWAFELGSPSGLVSRGWTKGELKKGDHVTVEGYGAKKKNNSANARTITLPDGRKLFGGFKDTPGNPYK